MIDFRHEIRTNESVRRYIGKLWMQETDKLTSNDNVERAIKNEITTAEPVQVIIIIVKT